MKKRIILFLILGLIIIGAGVFVYLNYFRLTPIDKWDSAKSSPREDYVVAEKDGKMLVSNKKAGISFAISDRWSLKDEDKYYASISFYSPQSKTNERGSIMEEGCKISVATIYLNTNIDTLKQKLLTNFSAGSFSPNIFETVGFKEKKTIKHSFGIDSWDMDFIGMHSLSRGLLYEIVLGSAKNDKNLCENQFYQFLETVSFN